MYTTNVIAADSSSRKKCISASSAWKGSADFVWRKRSITFTANSAVMCSRSQRRNPRSINARDFYNAQSAYRCWQWWWLSPKGTIQTGPSSFTTTACIASGIPCTLISREKILTLCSSSSITTKASIWDLHSKSCMRNFSKFTSTIRMNISKRRSLF